MFVERSKESKRIETRSVAVVPSRLKRIAADEMEVAKFKAVLAITDVGPLNLPHHIGLASARRTGTSATEFFQGDVAFFPVAPDQREFLADDFRAERMERSRIGHEEKLATVTDRRYIINS
jgi:hypothetical protein